MLKIIMTAEYVLRRCARAQAAEQKMPRSSSSDVTPACVVIVVCRPAAAAAAAVVMVFTDVCLKHVSIS